MAEYTFIPGSPACEQWERVLAEALDGVLRPEEEAAFIAHRSACPACAALFEEARRGREWLEFLSFEPEVPAGLLDKILAQTGPGQAVGYGLASGGNTAPMIPASAPAWQRPGLMGHIRRFAEPRLMMTTAMAFFSIAMTLNLIGLRLSTLRLSDLRLSAVRSFPGVARSFLERRLTMASTPIIRYYDHSRLVYEVQTGMRELRQAKQGEGQDEENRWRQQGLTPGESKESPAFKDRGLPVNSPQPPVTPAVNPTFSDSGFLETSLTSYDRSSTSAAKIYRRGTGPAHSGGSAHKVRERNSIWTA